jgi:hypothetical protein
MAEYVLDPGRWPEMPATHRAFLERAVPRFRADARLAGLAAGGSFVGGLLDEHSDLDFVVVSLPEASSDVLREGADIAQRLGPLLTAFPGDHVGEARLLICLYGPPLLHVDLKFVSTDELVHRVEDPTILWDRHGAVRAALSKVKAVYPQPQLQWIEDRFWVWVHYIAVKIARGELFEAIDSLGFVRARVLGPLSCCPRPAYSPTVCGASNRACRRVFLLSDRRWRHTTASPVETRSSPRSSCTRSCARNSRPPLWFTGPRPSGRPETFSRTATVINSPTCGELEQRGPRARGRVRHSTSGAAALGRATLAPR